MLSEVYQGL